MKIIDLLLKIVNNEEVPKKIRYQNNEWKFYKEFNDYLRIVDGKNVTLFTYYILKNILNDEIEIIETKPKEIDKLPLLENTQVTCDKYNKYFMSAVLSGNNNSHNAIKKKLNEVIDAINHLLEKSD